MTTYSKKVGPLEKGERSWKLEAPYLLKADAKGTVSRVHLADVVGVRMKPSPAKFRPWRHITVLTLRDSSSVEIDNAHFVGAAAYEDRMETYAPFVRGLIEEVAYQAPYARYQRGAPFLGFLATAVMFGVVFAMLAALIFMVPMDDLEGAVWMKLGVLAVAAVPLAGWVMQSKPVGVRLEELPESAFPDGRVEVAETEPVGAE